MPKREPSYLLAVRPIPWLGVEAGDIVMVGNCPLEIWVCSKRSTSVLTDLLSSSSLECLSPDAEPAPDSEGALRLVR